MPLNIVDFPTTPICDGKQLYINDLDKLADITARVLLGQFTHALVIVKDAIQLTAGYTTSTQREEVRTLLDPAPGNDVAIYHRDGLLFEIICWIAAVQLSTTNEVISMPHLKSTTQGIDTLKVTFDPTNKEIVRATVYEQKCTTNPRAKFTTQVLPEFEKLINGHKNSQLSSKSIELLAKYDLSPNEQIAASNKLLQELPLSLQASLTVQPTSFDTESCQSLFKNFNTSVPDPFLRFGDTFPLDGIRPWFQLFSDLVWTKVNV